MPAATRWTAPVAGFALMASGLIGSGLTAAGASSASPPQEAGMVSGRPFVDPSSAAAGTASQLSITLDAAVTRFEVGGRLVWGQAYNGSFVGPTLRTWPGQDITLTLINHLPVATNLHFHGLHVSPSGTSDDPFVCVPPDQTFVYHLQVPVDHPNGTFWYHSHAMGISCQAMGGPGDVENQIFAGLSGALVVGDNRSLLPDPLHTVAAHTLVLKDVQVDQNDRIVQDGINSNAPTARLVNGLLRPVLSMRPGETQLWRLVNAGADIFYRLQLDGQRFTVIGQDGRPVARATSASELLLPPGKRFDVLVTAPSGLGRTWLRTLAYSNGPQGDSYPDVRLMQLRIAGAPARRAGPTMDAIGAGAADLAQAHIAQHRALTLSENAGGTQFFINRRQFAMDSSVFATPAKLGTVEEWTIDNTSGEAHPFHLHTTAFQVVSVNGVVVPYGGRQDIVVVPHAVKRIPGEVVIRVPFDDYAGRWMFHCHIAAHEDNGMMSYIPVVR